MNNLDLDLESMDFWLPRRKVTFLFPFSHVHIQPVEVFEEMYQSQRYVHETHQIKSTSTCSVSKLQPTLQHAW